MEFKCSGLMVSLLIQQSGYTPLFTQIDNRDIQPCWPDTEMPTLKKWNLKFTNFTFLTVKKIVQSRSLLIHMSLKVSCLTCTNGKRKTFYENSFKTAKYFFLLRVRVSFYLQVFDQYLNFISLEDEMFTVRNQDRDSISYYGKRVLVISRYQYIKLQMLQHDWL